MYIRVWSKGVDNTDTQLLKQKTHA